MTWQPSAPLHHIVARAKLNRLIRDFFERRDVLEVETPLLCGSTATDPHLNSWSTHTEGNPRFLQTSPELCMKRLLAAGCGSIYQLCKAFRHEESSRQHNPEFTMLEWYRPDWSLATLLNEIEALVQDAAAAFGTPLETFTRMTFAQAFKRETSLDPHSCSDQDLLNLANARINGDFTSMDRDGLLDLLMSHLVEPRLPSSGVFITEFPASKASLAKIRPNQHGQLIAQRAELYIAGKEIANAYQELVDAAEQAERIKADQRYRQDNGLATIPVPQSLISALQNGFPESAGVALGVDRLLMVLLNTDQIRDVISFPFEQA
jgi:lysyl-tRNA synthetase class 2